MIAMPPRLSYPAVCLASLALITGCKPAATKATFAPPPPVVTVAKPIVKKVIDWDEFTGRLASPESVDIRARVSGYLEEVHFKEGTEIKEGDLLVTIDPRPYEAAVQRAQADVSSARSRAELAKTEAENAGPLLKSQAISSEESVRRLKASAEANSSMKAAEALLKAAELDLEFTRIRSPINGRISDARVTKGNLVTGGTKDATLLTTVVSLDPIYCFIECDERSALKYREMHKLGTRKSAMFAEIPAQMALANQSGFPHQGHLDFVDNVLNPTTGSIRARAVFENQDRLMSPGFFARVRIPGSGEYEGMLILDQAIADDQGRSFVWVIDADNKASYRPVVTGPLQDGMRVVREGLKAEDRVVINGLMSVRNGVTVVPQDAEMKLPVTK